MKDVPSIPDASRIYLTSRLSSLVSLLSSLLFSPLSALSLLHPYLVSLLSSLAAGHVSDRSSHLPLRTSHQVINSSSHQPFCHTNPGLAECAKRLNNNHHNKNVKSEGTHGVGVVHNASCRCCFLGCCRLYFSRSLDSHRPCHSRRGD